MDEESTIDDNMPDAPLDFGSAVAETPTEQPSPPEEPGKAAEPVEAETPAKDDKAPEGETTPEPTDTPEAEPTKDEQAAQRQQNAEMAARRVQERQQSQRQIAEKLDQVYGPKTADQIQEELEAQGVDEAEANRRAEIQAIREEMQYERQRSTIAELNAGMQSDAVNVMNDFSVFNEKSPEYDQEFTEQVFKAYNVAARVQSDENGIILNAEVPLYDFYKQMNDIYSRGSSKGSEKGQADAMEMLSRTESPGGASVKGSETLEEMGERLANMPIM